MHLRANAAHRHARASMASERDLGAMAADARHAARVMAGLGPRARDEALRALRRQLENGRDVIEAASSCQGPHMCRTPS